MEKNTIDDDDRSKGANRRAAAEYSVDTYFVKDPKWQFSTAAAVCYILKYAGQSPPTTKPMTLMEIKELLQARLDRAKIDGEGIPKDLRLYCRVLQLGLAETTSSFVFRSTTNEAGDNKTRRIGTASTAAASTQAIELVASSSPLLFSSNEVDDIKTHAGTTDDIKSSAAALTETTEIFNLNQ